MRNFIWCIIVFCCLSIASLILYPKYSRKEDLKVQKLKMQSLKKQDLGYEEVTLTSEQIEAASVDEDDMYSLRSNIDFNLKVESNLQNALAITKQAKSKFLVVLTDSENPWATTDFSNFLKEEKVNVSYYMHKGYNSQYDVFNYYLTDYNDEKWLKTNKISNNPSVIILNGDGDVLAVEESNLIHKVSVFDYYGNLYKKLKAANALKTLKKVLKNKKSTDKDLLTAFYNATITKFSLYYEKYHQNDNNEDDFKIEKIDIDRKEISQSWNRIIEIHQKDTKPDRYLTVTILKEIKDQGFYANCFNEDRVFNNTDFLAIDYLLKHYDAIQEMNIEDLIQETDIGGDKIELLERKLSSEIASALRSNIYNKQDGIEGEVNRNKGIAVHKKMIAASKEKFECYRSYFEYLETSRHGFGYDREYLNEFKIYFNTYLSPKNQNAIERLGELYKEADSYSEDWNSFKEYNSYFANSAALSSFEPVNSSFIKDAIAWSKYSLMLTKNHPDYLDTLAQLYYRNGQKKKAIATQELAVKYLENGDRDTDDNRIRKTLLKMKNGTY